MGVLLFGSELSNLLSNLDFSKKLSSEYNLDPSNLTSESLLKSLGVYSEGDSSKPLSLLLRSQELAKSWVKPFDPVKKEPVPIPVNPQVDVTTATKDNLLLATEMQDAASGISGTEPPTSFKTKVANNSSLINGAMDFANSALTGILGLKQEYDGPKGAITATMDQAYDKVQSVVSNLGPVGKVASVAMGANKLLGTIANKTGAGTDAMTTADAILGSNFLGPIGWINGYGGKKADTITKDDEAFAAVGSSYGGTNSTVNDALLKSGKKYGLVSGGARRRANQEIAEAKSQQSVMGSIADQANLRFDIQSQMTDIYSSKRAFDLAGGYQLSLVRAGKHGLNLKNLDRVKRLTAKVEFEYKDYGDDIDKFKEGGVIFEYKEYNEEIPFEYKDYEVEETPFIYKDYKEDDVISFKEGGEIEEKPKEYEPEDPMAIINYVNKHKKVDFVKRLKDSYRETIPNWEHENEVATHKMAVDDFGKGVYYVYPLVQNIDGELVDFTDPKNKLEESALESAIQRKDFVKFKNFDDALWFVTYYKDYYPTFDKYKEGGKFNVIPEGALHARLNHMDVENITKKGIPVISDDNGFIMQHAEIEHSEIIFRLEVTKKIEELQKKFDETQDDKYAIEAGELLVYEILENTLDNTGLINEVN